MGHLITVQTCDNNSDTVSGTSDTCTDKTGQEDLSDMISVTFDNCTHSGTSDRNTEQQDEQDQ